MKFLIKKLFRLSFKIITNNQQLNKIINHGKSRVRRFC